MSIFHRFFISFSACLIFFIAPTLTFAAESPSDQSQEQKWTSSKNSVLLEQQEKNAEGSEINKDEDCE